MRLPSRALGRLGALSAVVAGVVCGLTATPAYAVTSSIDHVESADGSTQVVLSLNDLPAGATPDFHSVTASLDGEEIEATARSLSDSADLRRTAVLAMDVSLSMAGERFEEAKLAAKAFLDEVPDNVRVGLVTFAGEVTVAQKPTLDHDALVAAIDGLTLSRWTRVHEGVLKAVEVSGDEGVRSILLLSDGEDTSRTPVSAVTTAVADAGVKVDAVALGEAMAANDALGRIVVAGEGQILTADDPAALSALFAEEAADLGSQVLVTLKDTDAYAGQTGTLQVALEVDGDEVSDDAFVLIPRATTAKTTTTSTGLSQRLAPAETGFLVPREWMYAGIAACVVAMLVLLVVAFGGSETRRTDDLDARIEAYTRRGARKLAEAGNQSPQEQTGVAQQAVAMAQNVLVNQKGLENALGDRLEAAGMAVKPAEWLLLHAGIALGSGLVGLLLGGGSAVLMLVGLALGSVLPWLFLGFKRRRRVAAFKAQLADTLQLMAGSLSAGLSLAQAVDTVVREGSDPMAAEFRRALVESRLGVEIEDALSGVGERMDSVDFEWVVMAIRIQREVGGNLAELLTKVAETIREREYLERQVKALSAEGRLSVWVLSGLPPGFMLYLLLVNPDYLHPMFVHPLGLMMLGGMSVMLVVGVLWMKKLVKVEV